jgi:hypothetical protein
MKLASYKNLNSLTYVFSPLVLEPQNRQKAIDTTKANAVLRNAKYEKVVMDYYRHGDTCYKIAQTLTALGLPTPNGSQQWQALQVKRVIKRLCN